MSTTVAVVGGGISGLAAAYRLSLTPDIRPVVFEAADRVGGVLHTERVDGWVIEHGPESFLSMKPRGIGLARELGLEERFQWTNPDNKGSLLLRGGTLYSMPEGLTGLIPSEFGPMARTRLVSPLGKLRMGLDFVIPARTGDDDETLESFVVRRLGRDVYDHLIEPLMAGIYSGSGSELSLAATFPQLRDAEREYGGLIKGVLAQRKARRARPIGHQAKAGFLSFQSGIQELVDALATGIVANGGELCTGQTVARVGHLPDGRFVIDHDGSWRSSSQIVDGVILAAPVHVQAKLLERLDADASAAMAEIPQVSSALVMLGYRKTERARPPRNSGYLSPRAEKRPVKAITWLSQKWTGRAPEGHFLVRGFVGRSGEQAMLRLDDDGLVQLVRDELSDVSGIEGEPVLRRVVRFSAASPQYTLGHLDRVRRIADGAARIPGLEIAGNMMRGVGIPDSIAAGEAAADRVTETMNR